MSILLAATYTKTGSPSNTIDPDWANVSYLLHGEGTNSGVVFTNSTENPDPIRAVSGTGNVVTSTTNPKFGTASMFFSGGDNTTTNGASLSWADAAPNQLGTGNFTAEMWINPTTIKDCILFSKYVGGAANRYVVTINAVGTLAFVIQNTSNVTIFQVNAVTPIVAGVWTHVAVVRSGTLWTLFINGITEASGTFSFNLDVTGPFCIGQFVNANSGFRYNYGGYIDEFRLTKGQALYTSNFSVPTAPFPNGPTGTNTILLLNFNGPTGSRVILDSSTYNHPVTFTGSGGISTTQFKFGGASLSTSSQSSYCRIAKGNLLPIGILDFCIEGWARQTSTAGLQAQILLAGYINPTGVIGSHDIISQLDIFAPSTYRLRFKYLQKDGTLIIPLEPGAITLNAWFHWAITRESGTIRCFKDGVSFHTGFSDRSYDDMMWTQSSSVTTDGNFRTLQGFHDDVRITRGMAVYTANFTPPTSQLTPI